MNRRTLIFGAVVLGAYGAVFWMAYAQDQEFRLFTWLTAAQACQGTARVIGGWGLLAETHYHQLVEAGRTI
jgi:hypothetical protein